MNIRSRPFPVGRLLLGVSVLSAAAMYSYQAHAAANRPPIPPGVAMKSWQDNGQGGRYLLQLAEGAALKRGKPITGVVTGDANCDADVEGLSHCHNTIALANGAKITVINSHNMHRNRCLGPGDQVSLTGISGPWIMGTLPEK